MGRGINRQLSIFERLLDPAHDLEAVNPSGQFCKMLGAGLAQFFGGDLLSLFVEFLPPQEEVREHVLFSLEFLGHRMILA